MTKSRIAAGAALLALAGAANAGSFSVTPTITNDYDFRGVTQTDEDFALQLGGTYSFDSGLYLGAWGSNVDPADPADDSGIEVDAYGGYVGSTNSFGYDVGAIYYSYSGFSGASDNNTLELYAGVSKEWLSGKLSFSNDYGTSGDSGFYLEANAAYPLPQNLSLLAHVGRSFGDASGSFAKTTDYSIGVGYTISNLNLAAKYIDADESALNADRFVLTLSTTFPWGE